MTCRSGGSAHERPTLESLVAGRRRAAARSPRRRAAARRRSSSSPTRRLRRAADDRRRRARAVVPRAAEPAAPGAATSRRSRTRVGGDADARRARCGSPRECAEDLAADGVVYAEVRFAPELHLEGGLTLDEVVEAVLDGFRSASARPRRRPDHRRRAAHRHAHGGALAARSPSWRCATATTGVVGFDIAGAEAGYPAHPPPRRVPARPAGELPHHDPRRRGVRPAVDLGGAAVVRRRAARPRRAHRRRHHRRRRRRAALGRLAGVRPRPARAARDVPDVERAHRRGAVDRRASRSACCGGCASGSRSTPTTG